MTRRSERDNSVADAPKPSFAAGVPAPAGDAGPVSGIELAFDDVPPARFQLDWAAAPLTCKAVVAHLPEIAECFHAIYSGTVAAFLLDASVVAPPENTTTCVLPGELLFTHYSPGVRHGHLNDLSEIYWPYDRYARPTIPGQFLPIAATVFGTFTGETETWTAFAGRCKLLRFEGTARLAVSTY
jgi:hypothetical protein